MFSWFSTARSMRTTSTRGEDTPGGECVANVPREEQEHTEQQAESNEELQQHVDDNDEANSKGSESSNHFNDAIYKVFVEGKNWRDTILGFGDQSYDDQGGDSSSLGRLSITSEDFENPPWPVKNPFITDYDKPLVDDKYKKEWESVVPHGTMGWLSDSFKGPYLLKLNKAIRNNDLDLMRDHDNEEVDSLAAKLLKPTGFDKWIKENPNPSNKMLDQLADKLCEDSDFLYGDKTMPLPPIQTLANLKAAVRPEPEYGRCCCFIPACSRSLTDDEIDDLIPALTEVLPLEITMAAWEGVLVEWFLDCFMHLREVLNFVQYNVPMWFFRNHGVPAILRHAGETRCYMLQHVDKLTPYNWILERENALIVNDATAFVSYTGDLSLEQFATLIASPDLRHHYVWTDVFCVDQFKWRSTTNEQNEEMKAFKDKFMFELKGRIESIGTTFLLIDKFDKAMHELGKIWVVWELFCSLNCGASFGIIMAPHEVTHLIQAGMNDNEEMVDLVTSMASLDVRKAQAWDPHDTEVILGLVEEHGGGATSVNLTLKQFFANWAVSWAENAYNYVTSNGGVPPDAFVQNLEAMRDMRRIANSS